MFFINLMVFRFGVFDVVLFEGIVKKFEILNICKDLNFDEGDIFYFSSLLMFVD